ncbi:Acetyltransferase (GNAT) domain-containing protein [Stigmatella aurantiaca]|uniref:Acetyltransferase (GNAT) domain-containing protein n=2 Tax=Stigmatella aurantiaca TaxID=41 RepID=A0A1H7YCY3_STIAU|nr:Acetyltransferase (GNAT) domain-containing protein [Stigmatella aurantiaca]
MTPGHPEGFMTTLRCHIATTQQQLDDALRVRWEVFGKELELLERTAHAVPRENNGFDTLATTAHVLVYADDVPVATARLLLPNPEVARATGSRLGIDLETKVDLSELGGPGLVFAETTRFCILKDWRHSAVLMWLYAGLHQESRRRGVTHWIASANTETDSAEDAHILFQVAAYQGLLSTRWRARTLTCPRAPEAPAAPFYTPEQRAHARQGRFEGLGLPPVLSLFSGKLGARFIAEPLYDARFRRFSLPLVSALQDVPTSTQKFFDKMTARASRG